MRSSYISYLKSEDWKERRIELLEEADYKCEECGKKTKTLHHLKYDNLGEEVYGVDVIALCKECHENLHLMEGKNMRGYGEYGEW